MNRVYIGTSGWAYRSWEGKLYPRDLPDSKHLRFYAERYPTVELSLTFYHLPALNTVRGWREKTLPGFVFAVSGSRSVVHARTPTDLDNALSEFFRRIRPLGNRTGPFLWRLPSVLRRDPRRLERLLQRLPAAHRHAVEFGHPSWLTDETFEMLRRYGAAAVSVSSLMMPTDLTVTADFIYIRFHGLADGAAHNYSCAELAPWAEHIRVQAQAGKTVYAYFNNDATARAPDNAMLLKKMVGKWAARPAA